MSTHLRQRIGQPSLVICLDSGCGNYDQLWFTTSLRGMLSATVTVEVLKEGVHSGDASGVVPSTFRILRQLLSRLEDEATGTVKPEALYAQIPADRVAQARAAAAALGDQVFAKFPFVAGAQPMGDDLVELVLNRTWRPQLAITGMDGAAAARQRRQRAAPMDDGQAQPAPPADPGRHGGGRTGQSSPRGGPAVRRQDHLGAASHGSGWNAPALAPWLERSLDQASRAAFGRPPAYMGEGGSIPFMAMLGETFPDAQFVVTGVLARTPMRMGPTSSCTSRRASGSPK